MYISFGLRNGFIVGNGLFYSLYELLISRKYLDLVGRGEVFLLYIIGVGDNVEWFIVFIFLEEDLVCIVEIS